jgi:hypothetical protein
MNRGLRTVIESTEKSKSKCRPRSVYQCLKCRQLDCPLRAAAALYDKRERST